MFYVILLLLSNCVLNDLRRSNVVNKPIDLDDIGARDLTKKKIILYENQTFLNLKSNNEEYRNIITEYLAFYENKVNIKNNYNYFEYKKYPENNLLIVANARNQNILIIPQTIKKIFKNLAKNSVEKIFFNTQVNEQKYYTEAEWQNLYGYKNITQEFKEENLY